MIFYLILAIKILFIFFGLALVLIGYKLILKGAKTDEYELAGSLTDKLKISLKSSSPGYFFVIAGILLAILPLIFGVPMEYKTRQTIEQEETKYDGITPPKPIKLRPAEDVFKSNENQQNNDKK
jgi:hypothetical protein